MTKKRNKKYNPMKTVGSETDRILKNMSVVFFTDDFDNPRDAEMVDNNGNIRSISTTQARALDELKHRWFITIAVGTVSSKGKKEIKLDDVPCKIRYNHRELRDYMNDRHVDFLETLENQNVRMVWTGWIAKPAGRELTDLEIDNIFTKLNAWE